MSDGDSDEEMAAALERELENAAESERAVAERPRSPPPPAPAPPQPAASPAQKRRRTVRRRSVSGPSAAPSPPRADETADDADAGYMWGMNVVTGVERSDQHATDPGGTSSAATRPLVRLTYGSYCGMELSRTELTRIKADERAELVAKRK